MASWVSGEMLSVILLLVETASILVVFGLFICIYCDPGDEAQGLLSGWCSAQATPQTPLDLKIRAQHSGWDNSGPGPLQTESYFHKLT